MKAAMSVGVQIDHSVMRRQKPICPSVLEQVEVLAESRPANQVIPPCDELVAPAAQVGLYPANGACLRIQIEERPIAPVAHGENLIAVHRQRGRSLYVFQVCLP